MTTTAKAVNATLEKAKSKTEQVSRYAEQLKKNVATFRVVPGFSKYEVSAGGVLRNRQNQQVQSIPKGKAKYYIFNDKGERRNISAEEIQALLPKVEKEKVKAAKAPSKATADRKPRESKAKAELSAAEIEQLKNKPAVKKILEAGGKKHVLCYKLHTNGLSAPEIMALVGTPYNATKRNIWLYESGQKKLEA